MRELKVTATDAKSTPTEAQNAHKESGKATSRTVLALIFAALGAKVGGIVGGKAGFIRAAMRKPEEAEKTAETVAKYTKNRSFIPEGYEHYIKDTVAYGAISSVIGGIGGAILGWTRGNRIENPGDLLSKPIESIGKIFGPEPEKTDVSPHNKNTSDSPAPEVAFSEKPKTHTSAKSPAK